jgi:hypothetical protein
MPEIVTCPVCGCKVQMPEGMLGRRVRCFGCDNRFVAAAESASPPGLEPLSRPSRVPPTPTSADPSLPRPLPPAGNDEPGDRRPFCPGCGRSVPWKARCCPHCGEEYDEGDATRDRRLQPRFRRDALPHRGALLSTLGNVSLAAGALSLCFGVAAVIGIPLGAAVWIMAQSDLNQMRAGSMDALGRQPTEAARVSAITGLILSLLFAAGYGAMFFTQW